MNNHRDVNADLRAQLANLLIAFFDRSHATEPASALTILQRAETYTLSHPNIRAAIVVRRAAFHNHNSIAPSRELLSNLYSALLYTRAHDQRHTVEIIYLFNQFRALVSNEDRPWLQALMQRPEIIAARLHLASAYLESLALDPPPRNQPPRRHFPGFHRQRRA